MIRTRVGIPPWSWARRFASIIRRDRVESSSQTRHRRCGLAGPSRTVGGSEYPDASANIRRYEIQTLGVSACVPVALCPPTITLAPTRSSGSGLRAESNQLDPDQRCGGCRIEHPMPAIMSQDGADETGQARSLALSFWRSSTKCTKSIKLGPSAGSWRRGFALSLPITPYCVLRT
jgi:hypothetical protein